MKKRNGLLAVAVVSLAFGACGNSGQAPGSGGSGGQSMPGIGGSSAGGTVGTASGGAGGTAGTGGADTGGTAGMVAVDAAVGGGTDASVSDGAAATTDGGAPPAVSGDMIAWYECEADGNVFTKPAKITTCEAGPCAPGVVIKELLECCSGGKKVSNVERGKGALLMNKVAVPADGTYDVAWWYHCGKNDNFMDPGCGGDPNRTKSGCRPHLFVVNGVKVPKTYEFACFPGSWGLLHVATTPLDLKMGDNTIHVTSTNGNDAADLDAIAIYPAGKGPKPIPFAH